MKTAGVRRRLQYTTCFVRNSSFFAMVGLMVAHVWGGHAGIPPDGHIHRDKLTVSLAPRVSWGAAAARS